MKKRMTFCAAALALLLSSCGQAEPAVPPAASPEPKIEAPIESTYVFKDKDTLYGIYPDDSVETMYLTVTSGNEDDNTNHTWTEVNSYSVYDYEAMGVERYAVNGLVQMGDENGPVSGELGYGRNAPNATVCVRGQTSSRNVQKNFKIRLMDDRGTWRDQTVINLNKHTPDFTRFANKLSYKLQESMPNMVSLQTQFVHLYVRDYTEGGSGEFEDYGLYTHVEQPNKGFLRRHGLDMHGQLYKINFFEFYRYEDVIRLKTDSKYDQALFESYLEIKGNDDHSKLIATLEELNDSNISIEEILEKRFDVDNLTSWMAFQMLMGNNDVQSRNTLLYSPQNRTKWYLISWDNDQSFERTYQSFQDRDSVQGWENGISNYWGNVLFRRCLQSEEFRKALDSRVQEFRSMLTDGRMENLVERYSAVVKPYITRSPDLDYLPLELSEYKNYCASIPKEIDINYQCYLDSLNKPMPFFISLPTEQEDKLEFTWGNAFDFDEENVFYTFELARSYGFTDPIVQEKDLFIPSYTYEGTLKPGQYFIRVTATNESGYSQPAFDYYVDAHSQKHYGILCFYVLQDGSITLDERYE